MLRETLHSYYQLARGQTLSDPQLAFDEFVHVITQDLGAPLRSISNYTQLLEEKCHKALDARALQYVEHIQENSRRMQARIAALLQFSRLNIVPLKPERVDGKAIVNHCLAQLKDDIEESEALLHVGTMPYLTADGERLSLLFYCLLSNALTYCKKRPDITVSAQRGEKMWLFSVRDNGIGIEPSQHEAIFEVFHRLHPDSAYPGTGMGLTLARRIAELHGGILWVESVPAEGAVFYFIIPDAK